MTQKAKCVSHLVRIGALFALTGLFFALLFSPEQVKPCAAETANPAKAQVIKWVDFNVPSTVLIQALSYDVESFGSERHAGMVDLLALTAAKTGAKWGKGESKELKHFYERITAGETVGALAANYPYFPYYREAYDAVLGGFVGEYAIEEADSTNGTKIVNRYGLKAFSPIAKGYGFGHYDDFGSPRSYGFSRPHLGNDLMGAVGTPLVAVEDGVVEALGWNQYGGWRIGIRSHDRRRYYYYAHLRKDHPYVKGLQEGDTVHAGDVIGYLGMTGYSAEENVNNIDVPHLHFGIQLIFDESQKDCDNEIWIDVYQIVELLQQNRSAVKKNTDTGEYERVCRFADGGSASG